MSSAWWGWLRRLLDCLAQGLARYGQVFAGLYAVAPHDREERG